MNVLPIDGRLADAAPARSEPELSLVPPAPAGERARRLLQEAKAVSLEHLKALQEAIEAARGLSDGVVDGGELYGPGLHDFAKRLSEELLWRAKTLEALVERQRAALTH